MRIPTGPLSLAIAFALMAGCGGGSDQPKIGTVKGTVIMDGIAVPNAIVDFSPAQGRPSSGVTNELGQYTLKYSQSMDGAVVGPHTVKITTGHDAMLAEGVEVSPAVEETIPAKYNTETELKVDVVPGENMLDFELRS